MADKRTTGQGGSKTGPTPGREVSAEYLKAIFENTPGRITTINARGRILHTNRVVKNSSFERVIGTHIWDYYLPEYHQPAKRVIAEVLKTGQPGDFEVKLQQSTGGVRWYHVRVGRLDLPGTEPQLILFGTDIARRKKAEETLRDSEERYRMLVENANEGVTVVANGKILYFNPKALEITGYSAEELAALPNRATIHPEDQAKTLLYREMRRTGKPAPKRYNFRIIRKDGQVRWIDFYPVHNIPWKGQNAVIQFFSDITERKLAEEALRQSEAHLLGLLESAEEFAVIRFIWDDAQPMRSKIVLASPSAKTILGMEDPFDLDIWYQRLHPEDKPIIEKSLARGVKTGVINHTYRFYHSVKKIWVWIQVLAKATLDKQGNPEFGNGIMLDISDRIRMEREMAQSQRLQSIGRLAAGIAHEINSPAQHLTANAHFLWNAFTRLLLLIDLLSEAVEQAKNGQPLERSLLAELEAATETAELKFLNQEVPQAIQATISGLGRISEIINSVKKLSHPGGQTTEEINLAQTIETAVTLTKNQWQPVAELKVDIQAGLPPLRALPGELDQVLVNLIVNAAQALADPKRAGAEEKGRITISVRNRQEFLEVAVADTGPGLPPGSDREVFEPFFTTKQVGQGTGLGLAICRNIIVDKHGGRLECCNRPEGGACFTILLPLETGRAIG